VPREEYQAALDELRADVVGMSDRVLARLDLGLRALREKDDALAREVRDGDGEINDLYLELEAECIDLFALQQPVASDLRFVAASFKVITDLERISDLATNLGRYALSAEREAVSEVDVYGIGTETHDQVATAMDAYATDDADACHGIVERDDHVDSLCQRASERVVRDLIEREVETGDSWAVERLMDDVSRLLLTIRDLERVGDHAVNIAARTHYMVENDDQFIY
jgi:phosphate transport system protein